MSTVTRRFHGTRQVDPVTARELDAIVRNHAEAISDIPVLRGAGTPEGSVVAPVGYLYLRTDGGASTTLYVKESGSGPTGWVAK